jgi:hypothetical protein
LEVLVEGIIDSLLDNEPAQTVLIRITELSLDLGESTEGAAGVNIYREWV